MAVNSGVDSLVIGFCVSSYTSDADFTVLAGAKLKAGEKMFNSKGAAVKWFGKDFVVKPGGAKGYEWILENGDVHICVAKEVQSGRIIPELFITFRAEYLWRVGYEAAFNEVNTWISTWANICDNRVSRADLCIDIQMPFPKLDPKRQLVTRARHKAEYIEVYASGCRGTGYKVGKDALVARIYNKHLEIKASRKEWFKDIWLYNGWDGKTPVIRVEFQARRLFLKDMAVDNFDSLLERLADMWRYFTHQWLTVRIPGEDKHRHRWPIIDWWVLIQGEYILFGEPLGVLRHKQPQVRYDHLMRQGKGVLLTAVAAASSRFGIEHGIFKVVKDINEWFNDPGFKNEVAERSARISTISTPSHSTLLAAAIEAGGEIEAIEERG